MVKKELTLEDAPTGCTFTIKSLTGPCSRELREMGFCEGLNVTKVTNNNCVLCNICGAKYAICKDFCSCVHLNENQSQNP
jgi:Fe2+ transport system protein FeoA